MSKDLEESLNSLLRQYFFKHKLKSEQHPTSPQNILQLSPEGEVNSGGYIPRREASSYISTALHRP